MPEPETVAPPETPAAPPVEEGPTKEELLAALNQERYARQQQQEATVMAQQQAALAWTSRQATAQSTQAQPDPLANISTEMLSDPESARRNLANYVTSAARAEAERASAQTRQQMQQEMARQNDLMQLRALSQRHPELSDAAKYPEIAGEALKIKLQYEARGLPQAPEVYLDKAVQGFREKTRGAQPPPAYVEGGGNPGGVGHPGAMPNNAEPRRNQLEEKYKMKPGTIVPPWTADREYEETVKYIKAENADREKHGIMPMDMTMLESANKD
jgi:hypothetical protein